MAPSDWPRERERLHLPDPVVLSDYSFLSACARQGKRTEHTAHPVGLVTPDPALSAAEVARTWAGLPSAYRRVLSPRLARELAPLLATRDRLNTLCHTSLERVQALLRSLAPKYLALLSDESGLRASLLPVLHAYPTPAQLHSAATAALPRLLRVVKDAPTSRIATRLMAYAQSEQAAQFPTETARAWVGTRLITAELGLHQDTQRHLSELDAAIHDYPARAALASTTPIPAIPAGVTAFRRPVAPLAGLSGSSPQDLLARADELMELRTSEQRQPTQAYAEFLLLHEALTSGPDRLSPAEEIRLETIGQMLALSAMEPDAAVRHRARCLTLSQDEPPSHAPEETTPENIRADAMIAMALTELSTMDMVGGVPALRAALGSELMGVASPALQAEAVGLFAAGLMFFGEHHAFPGVGEQAAQAVQAAGADGPARAPSDLATYFLAVNDLSYSTEELEELRQQADRSTRDTIYRYYFHYVAMLSAYITKDAEAGVASYFAISTEGVWPRFNDRFRVLAQRAYAMLLAAQGDLAAARRELAAIRPSFGAEAGAAGAHLHHGLMRLRLELAAGRDDVVLEATLPDGEFGEHQIDGPRTRRYLGLSLLLRGTILARRGAHEDARRCFERATAHAVAAQEWVLLCAGETPEYRAWLQEHSPANPPSGLTSPVLQRLLGRPVLIGTEVPRLTRQQLRILPLLAQGRSVDSIAAELHITKNTMKSHLRLLYERLGVRSREQAVLRAGFYGLVP